jgi:hypothetical protein
MPLKYKALRLACAFRADFIVNRCVLIEVMQLDALGPPLVTISRGER